jgi:hypothetical protein
MTLEQVKAARPTKEYDGLYAGSGSAYTADMFVESVFKSLSTGRGQIAAPKAPILSPKATPAKKK